MKKLNLLTLSLSLIFISAFTSANAAPFTKSNSYGELQYLLQNCQASWGSFVGKTGTVCLYLTNKSPKTANYSFDVNVGSANVNGASGTLSHNSSFGPTLVSKSEQLIPVSIAQFLKDGKSTFSIKNITINNKAISQSVIFDATQHSTSKWCVVNANIEKGNTLSPTHILCTK